MCELLLHKHHKKAGAVREDARIERKISLC
jgi:hypothetical protein